MYGFAIFVVSILVWLAAVCVFCVKAFLTAKPQGELKQEIKRFMRLQNVPRATMSSAEWFLAAPFLTLSL